MIICCHVFPHLNKQLSKGVYLFDLLKKDSNDIVGYAVSNFKQRKIEIFMNGSRYDVDYDDSDEIELRKYIREITTKVFYLKDLTN